MIKIDDVEIYDAVEFDASYIRDVREEPKTGTGGNRGTTKKKRDYKHLICTFDIETSRVEVGDDTHAFMYIWQVCMLDPDTMNFICVIGRLWEEWKYFLNTLKRQLKDNEYLVFYVHNLSHEFQFMTGIMPLEDVFATAPRKVLKCSSMEHFEFRCSYILTNRSLDSFTSQMKVKHQKLTGTIDYNVVRYPWTELDETVIKYSVWDTVGQAEAIAETLKRDGDTLYTIPLTSTGYVRRDCKKAMKKACHYRLVETLPTYEVYDFAKKAFRGGDTHANRYYVQKIIKNGLSNDGQSAYPDKDCNELMPVGVWFEYPDPTPERICQLARSGKKAMLMHIAMRNVELLNIYYPDPYIPISKCEKLSSYIADNGRVLACDYLETYVTDIDLKIILDVYKADDIEVLKCYTCAYGYLPPPLVETIRNYYQKKTELKHVEGMEYELMKSKNKLNSTYGMMVQDMIQDTLTYDQKTMEWIPDTTDRRKLFEKAHKKAWLSYCWGVWTTARQRLSLHEAIHSTYNEKTGMWDAFYWDTDSVKFIDPDGVHAEWFKKKNEELIASRKDRGSYATDIKGNTQYMGIWDLDGEYDEFATLGAKKYVYKLKGDDALHITIAGVNKKLGAKELEEGGGIERFINLDEPFVFKDAGGLDAIYNDVTEPFTINKEGHDLRITSNVALVPGEYTLGITAEYHRLLETIFALE